MTEETTNSNDAGIPTEPAAVLPNETIPAPEAVEAAAPSAGTETPQGNPAPEAVEPGIAAPVEAVGPAEREAEGKNGATVELAALLAELAAVRAMAEERAAKMAAELQELRKSFDMKLKYDAKKDAIIDRQATELEAYKKGLLEKSALAFAQDLIAEVDSAEKLSRYYDAAECTEENFRKLRKALKDMSLSLCDVLEKYGIVAYRTAPGGTFDPRRQRARLTTKTGDKALEKTVKALLGAGFEQEREDGSGTKVLRPELVDVYVFDPGLAAPPPPESVPAAEPVALAEEKVPEQPAAADGAGTPPVADGSVS